MRTRYSFCFAVAFAFQISFFSLAVAQEQSELVRSLEAAFREVRGLQSVHVEAPGAGVLRLTGSVDTAESRERAEELAAAQDGVILIDNQLEIQHKSLSEHLSISGRELRRRATEWVEILPTFGAAALIFVLGVFLARLVRKATFLARLISPHPLLQTVILRVLSTGIIIGSILLALDLLGATAIVGALLGTAGVVGLAVGFAFKDIVENYIAGILLAVHRPFSARDAVSISGFDGVVVRLGARETMLMTFDGNHVQIPNAQVFASPVLNYSRNPKRRFNFAIGIGNGEGLAPAQKLIIGELDAMEGVLQDPKPLVVIDGFGDSSMTMSVSAWVDQRSFDYFKVKSEAIRRTKRVLDENGVDLPNPIFHLYTEQVKPSQLPNESAESVFDVHKDNELEKQIDLDPESASGLLQDSHEEEE